MKQVLTTLGILIVLGVLAAAAVIYSGVFNVAATVADAAPLRWLMTLPKMSAADYDALDRRVPPGTAPQ